MKAAQIPLNFRDYCADILIPLNICRRETWHSPFQCTDLRHAYEKCQHDEYARKRKRPERRPALTPAASHAGAVRVLTQSRFMS